MSSRHGIVTCAQIVAKVQGIINPANRSCVFFFGGVLPSKETHCEWLKSYVLKKCFFFTSPPVFFFVSDWTLQDWQEALERFGHCFRASEAADPRFVAEAVDREVQRIDGEFQDGLSAGLRRVFFFLGGKCFMMMTSRYHI